MRAWLLGLSMLVTAPGRTQATVPPTPLTPPKPLEAPVCAAAGKWKGSVKTPEVSSADGGTRLYGWLQWDRPAKWTGQRCEAVWWIMTAVDGGRFKPILARQDFLQAGQQASLAVVGFSADGSRAAADVTIVTEGRAGHGYFVANLREHTSCMGSAVRGLDGVRAELALGHEPMRSDIARVGDDGWLDLSPRPGGPVATAAERSGSERPRFQFEPCSGKLRTAGTP